MGFMWGDTEPLSRTYRRPLEGEKRNMLAGFGAKMKEIAKLSKPQTPEAYYAHGRSIGINFPRVPKADVSFHDFSVKYNALKNAGGFADMAQSVKFKEVFVSAREALSKDPAMQENAWPAGWSYVAELERKVNDSSDANEKSGYLIQFFGFMRGLDEVTAEQRFVRDGGVMPESEKDQNVYRILLAAVYGDKLVPVNIINGEPKVLEQTGGIAGEINGLEKLVDTGIRGPEVMQDLNPIIAEIIDNGGVLPNKGAGAATQAWAISELFRMYDSLVITDRRSLVGRQAIKATNVRSAMGFNRAG
jgi:hypothetical protein